MLKLCLISKTILFHKLYMFEFFENLFENLEFKNHHLIQKLQYFSRIFLCFPCKVNKNFEIMFKYEKYYNLLTFPISFHLILIIFEFSRFTFLFFFLPNHLEYISLSLN